MPEHEFRLMAIIQALENDLFLAEALFFPEVSCFGDKLDRLLRALKKNARRLAEADDVQVLYRRHLGGSPISDRLTITLEPPRGVAWRKPVTLTFPFVRWAHGEDAHIAFIPALGVEVVAEDAEELQRVLLDQVRFALMRLRKIGSLEPLLWLQRCQDLRLEEISYTATVLSPKQAALKEHEQSQRPESVLPQVGTELTGGTVEAAYEVEDLVARLAEALTSRRPRSVLLIGPSGVGKTALVHELVRRRTAFGLGSTPFWATSGSRLVAGMTGFGMWEERCVRLWREASKKKAILHLGNLVELMEVGKSEIRGQGIATFFRPYLARGDLLTIAECTPEQVPVIERQDPHLLEVFLPIPVEEPPPEKGRRILERCARTGDPRIAHLDGEGLETLDRLHRRYATYSVSPGRPLRFLRNLLNDGVAGQTLTAIDVTRAFARETGLPLFLLEESVRLDLARTRQWLTARVIGQNEAVDLVVDLLATVKAGLSRPRKPIASLLFIGPTGVGKTEMAKALAEFLFGDRNRLTRLDMSEYADVVSVQRLIGGGITSEGVLTARVREQPFVVVLFDEFEKAHPLFFDLLLQILGEGRLTDAGGRLADFANAVVIMTSNLGAESFQQGAFGFASDGQARSQARDHFVNEVRAFVRPELFNRIDRIVPFAPLDEETTLHIARRQLALLAERDGIRYRGVRLELAPEVAIYLGAKATIGVTALGR